MICPGCQTLNFRDYKFCRECGHKLELPPPAQPTMALDAAPVPVNEDVQVQRLLDEAFRALEAGNLSDAALACQGALALRPESTAAHSLLGLVYERQGGIPDAIQQYKIVLDLNPTSKADRAKLDALLWNTGQKRRTWWDRSRQLPRRTLAGAAVTVLVLVTGLLVVARSAAPPEGGHRRLNTPAVRTALDPAPPVSYPPPAAAVPAPPPPVYATPSTAPGVGAVPRHTLTNDPLPQMTQITQSTPRLAPRDGTASRPPTFLPPAPIRGVSGFASRGLQPARGAVPVLPDPQAPSAPAAEAPPIMPAVTPAPTAAAPVSAPQPPPAPDNGIPGTSINIRRLDGENPGNTNPQIPPPSLADARYHYNMAGELYRRGDVEGAYREFSNARDLFQRVNSRGGSEGVLAAEGALASHRAMQQIAATRR
jgi:hypothetical protein